MIKTRYYTILMMLAALAVCINIVESLFLPPLQFGIRLGLANIISLITLKLYGSKAMFAVCAVRVLVANLLKGIIFGTSFWIGAMGVFMSCLALTFCEKWGSSLCFSSMISAIMHSLGQLLVISFLYGALDFLWLLPPLIIMSLFTGFITYVIAKKVLERIRL